MFVGATEARGNCTTLPVATFPPLPASGASGAPAAAPTATTVPGAPTATALPAPTTAPGAPTATPTATIPPTAPVNIAPVDNFAGRLNLTVESTATVSEAVSYPDGDTQDEVYWEITGLNPNVALPDGRVRLVITATCSGTGTENVTFVVTGQTFACGQTLVNAEATFDNSFRLGVIRVNAVGGTGTFVQWTVTATTSRVN